MNKIVLMLMLCVSSSALYSTSPMFSDITPPQTQSEQEKEYQYLTRQINSLVNLKDYYVAKAARFRNRGDRLQFQGGGDNIPEAQKLWKQAREYDKISQRIQVEIDKLKEQRESFSKSK